MAHGFERVTTVVRLPAAARRARSEDVTPYGDEDDTLHVLGAGPRARRRVDAGRASATTSPPRTSGRSPPEWGDMQRRWRNWAFQAAALDLALAQAGRPLHAVLGREPRAAALRQLARAGRPARRSTRSGAGWSATPGCASSSTRRRRGREELIDEVAATGAVEIIDFKGHYGMETGELPALLTMYERVIAAASPTRCSRTRTTCRRSPRCSRPRRTGSPTTPRSPRSRGPRRDAARARRGERQAVPGRRPAHAARRLRRVRGARAADVRRRDGRARPRPRPDPAPGLAVPRRRRRTTPRPAATTPRRRRRTCRRAR